VSVDLCNDSLGPALSGDAVGVVTKWEWPDPMDGVTGSDFERVAAAIRAGGWRENSQAKDWVGVPVARALNLSLAVSSEWAKVAALVKIWVAFGALVVVERPDQHRKSRKYVEARDE
jgi:hypothetical protein